VRLPGPNNCLLCQAASERDSLLLLRLHAVTAISPSRPVPKNTDGAQRAPPQRTGSMGQQGTIERAGSHHHGSGPSSLENVPVGPSGPRRHGIEAAPQAFIDLLKGRNFGKQLVELG